MNIGIVGSRKSKSRKSIESLVKSLPKDSVIISGGCAGPDTWAEETASALGLKVFICLPDLPAKGSPRYEFTKAYHKRNKLIADSSDILHAFVSPERTGGTENTIKHAIKAGIPVVIHNPE